MPLKMLSGFSGLLAVILPLSAWADGLSIVASISNYYFYRGYSKTADSPSIRANLDYSLPSGFYAGVWLSRLDIQEKSYSDPSEIELYPYVGFSYKLNDDWRLDTAISRYIFDGRLMGRYSDFNEYSAAIHFRDLVSARIDFSDNLYHRGKAGLNYELSGRYPILDVLKVSAGAGYNQTVSVLEYDTLYWNFGFTFFYKYVALDVRYIDTFWTATSTRDEYLILPDIPSRFSATLSLGF